MRPSFSQTLEFDPASVRHWDGGGDRNIPVAMVPEFTRKIAGVELGHFSLVIRRAASALDYLRELMADHL